MTTQNFTLTGYQTVDRIYSGTRTLVYRGFRTSDKQPVAIKVLRSEYPSFSELVQFRNQYTIAKNLNLPGIIQTYSLEAYQNSYALVMEDFGGISLKEWREQGETAPNLRDFLQMAIDISNTLDILCHHRIIHKDIKPANILINPQTKQVKLIDFSIASLLPRETQTLMNPNVLEGTLGYLSPEQTGRMNRGIDYRTDFYSLGVTFYDLLAGELPFESIDAMELVHCHIAKQPPSLHDINPEIPSVLSSIVSKLMAKNAEDRYQSALGLKYDLELCLRQLQESGKIEGFEIAQRDVCDRFNIPEKLYGRETEVQALLNAFDRVSQANTELMLVAGFSGIGKTAVINEVHKPIVRQRGYFIKGKFDQFNRNIPFSAFVQALRDLMRQLLSESDAQLAGWKTQILVAVGENGQVLIDVIPELEQIVGKQPSAPELSGSAAQNRFNLLFQKFVEVFATVEHPLVLFLDDLQWADLASLQLLKLLMNDNGYLLILGAYRDNEVSLAHPFILTVEELKKAQATVHTITLEPLAFTDTNHLVADTLNCSRELAQPLTALIDRKTQGNPFFTTQFLKALYEEGYIRFDRDRRYWECDMAQVKVLSITDDVVEFMALQLQKLPPETQQVIKLAACVGNQFDLSTLAIVSEQSPIDTATVLWKALQDGLILPTSQVYKFFQSEETEQSETQNTVNPVYRFLHDRVQQAAYSLIPDNQKQAIHLKIGQLIQENSSEIEQEEKLFDIVGHLNLGQSLINQQQEREALAKLNLKAGRKARSSTAYVAATIYIQTGIELLTDNSWKSQYELTLNLYVSATEAAYLNGDIDGMEQMAQLVLQNAQTILDKVKIYDIQITSLTTHCHLLEAIAVGRDVLKQLGVEFPTEPDEAFIGKGLQALAKQLQGRQIEELADLPVMTDFQTQAAMQILARLFAPISAGMPGLAPILSFTMVSLSIKFGNAPASTIGYAAHGMVMCAFLGEVKQGYNFGKLAINLLDRFNIPEVKAIVPCLFGSFIQHHQELLSATLPTLKAGYVTGIETGNFLFAGYNSSAYGYAIYFGGQELSSVESEMIDLSVALGRINQYSAQRYVDITRQMVQNLMETMSQPDALIGVAYDEIVMAPKHHQNNDVGSLALVYIYKMLLAYVFGNYPAALDHTIKSKEYLIAVAGLVIFPIFHFYAALTQLAVFPTESETKQAEIIRVVETHQITLHQWAKNAPMNYLHKWYLVEAEKHRVLGNKAEAIENYDRAIQLAKENQFLNEEALANELAAKFYLDWGKEKVAAGYMQAAYYCYARWGARAKTHDLETRYRQLLSPILQAQRDRALLEETRLQTADKSALSDRTIQTTYSSSSSISESLDFATIFKASQALSSQMQLEQLLPTFLRIVMENAGATKAALLLLEGGNLTVEATANLNESVTLRSVSLETNTSLPVTLIDYVKRTLTTVVMDNATARTDFIADSYLMQKQPKSLLCEPILYLGKLSGLLYLENQLTIGAFTKYRLEVIQLLCTQAAISLENARLYQQSQAYAQELERSLLDLQQAQLQIVQSEKMSALGNLVAGVAHEINNPVGFINGNIDEATTTIKDVINHLKLYQEKLPNPGEEIEQDAEDIDLEYALADLPKMLSSMKVGCDRIRGISTSLRTFSRADKDYKVPFKIHEGIDSTILILKHRLKANEHRPAIEVVTDYGNLPQVECFPGQLNQVFMNLLANAIDALDESSQGRSFAQIEANPNCITVRIGRSGDRHIMIIIADNGAGMTEAVKQRIFDHLFTTKAVGKGTGLGLAIARQIVVETHGGTIEVNSTLGVGTEFAIVLPVSQESH